MKTEIEHLRERLEKSMEKNQHPQVTILFKISEFLNFRLIFQNLQERLMKIIELQIVSKNDKAIKVEDFDKADDDDLKGTKNFIR